MCICAQVSSKDQIVEQLDKVIKDLNDGGACNELKSAEAKFKKMVHSYICCMCSYEVHIVV